MCRAIGHIKFFAGMVPVILPFTGNISTVTSANVIAKLPVSGGKASPHLIRGQQILIGCVSLQIRFSAALGIIGN